MSPRPGRPPRTRRWRVVSRRPSLVLQGELDERVAPAQGRALYDALGGAKRWSAYPGVGHGAFVETAPGHWRADLAALLVRVP